MTVNETEPEVLILLSGGIDSAACVAFYLEMGRRPCAMFVDYQQPAARQEAFAAQAVSDYYRIHLTKLVWNGQTQKSEGLIPSRNAFLLTAALMERPSSVTTVAIGIHTGTNYKDCSSEFVVAMQTVYDVYGEGRISIATPFGDWTKGEIYAYCDSQRVPIALTYSCERSGEMPCGECLSCLDRRMIFAST